MNQKLQWDRFYLGWWGKVGNFFLTENEDFCLDPAPSGVKLYTADLRPTLRCWSHAEFFQLQAPACAFQGHNSLLVATNSWP